LLSLEAQHYAPNTVKAYETDIWAFADFLDLWFEQSWTWQNLDRGAIRAYLARALNRQSRRSVGRAGSTLRTFFSFLGFDAHLNPARAVTTRYGLRLPICLRAQEVPQLVVRAEQRVYRPWRQRRVDGGKPLFATVRDLALLELFLGSGLRLMEAVDVNVTDLDLSPGNEEVNVVGRAQRVVPLSDASVRAFRLYSRRRAALIGDDPNVAALFLDMRGSRLDARGVKLAMASLFRVLRPPLHVRALRHTFATRLLDRGAPLIATQAMLGYVSIAATAIYEHTSRQPLLAIYNHAHARLRGAR
jgi:site-specific recombinase XerD